MIFKKNKNEFITLWNCTIRFKNFGDFSNEKKLDKKVNSDLKTRKDLHLILSYAGLYKLNSDYLRLLLRFSSSAFNSAGSLSPNLA